MKTKQTLLLLFIVLSLTLTSFSQLTHVATATVPVNGIQPFPPHRAWGGVIHDNILYVGSCQYCPGKIARFNLTDFTTISVLTLEEDECEFRSLVVNNGFLYAATYRHWTSGGWIVKVNLTDFTRVSALTLSANEDMVRGMVTENGFLYYGCDTSPAKIVKVNLTDFTKMETLTLDTGENKSRDMLINDNFLYVALSSTPGKIAKINLTDFTETSTLTFASGEDETNHILT